jgi:hypothetical protein
MHWPPEQLSRLSDLKVAALLWHMQIAEFARNWPLVESRARSLDCDALLMKPLETLNRLDEFFSLGFGREKLAEIASGPVFQKNAKDPGMPLDLRLRREQNDAIARQLGPSLDDIVAWSYEACPATSRAAPLPKPLIAIEKRYL